MELNQTTFLTKASAVLVAGFAISSCDSGGSSGGASAEKPAAPTLKSIETEGIASFRFTWDAVADVTHYQLAFNRGGTSGFTDIGDKINKDLTSITLPVPLYEQLNSEYIIAACNDAGCTDSSAMGTPAAAALNAAIGYIKGNAPSFDARFGYSVSLSDDGSRMAVGAHNHDIKVGSTTYADIGAVYIFVKSGTTWSQEKVLTPTNFNNVTAPNFGVSVSISGDGSTLAVGAWQEDSAAEGINSNVGELNNSSPDRGAVFVYTRSGTTWSQQAYVKPSTGSTDNSRPIALIENFGYSVSLSDDGNVLVAGAPVADVGLAGVDEKTNSGLAYVFSRSGSTWSEQGVLSASDWQEDDKFGDSVSVSGDGSTVAVGATEEDGSGANQNNSGTVYVFTESSGTWSEEADIKASDASTDNKFGYSISLSETGDTLAVGAIGENSPSTGVLSRGADDNPTGTLANSGAVYVFDRSGTSWSEVAFIKASNTGAGDQFGQSVSLSDDALYLAVGALWEDGSAVNFSGQNDDTKENAGAAYVFKKDSGSWAQTAYVKATNTEIKDQFGASVSINNNGTLLVGATTEDSFAKTVGGGQGNDPQYPLTANIGAAYLY